MRSRSKKGEVGLCCAQPCCRPGPIVIMVLPTVFNRSLICCRSVTGRLRRITIAPQIVSTSSPRGYSRSTAMTRGRRTIHHNSSLRKTCVTPFYELAFKKFCRANGVPRARSIADGKPCAAMNTSLEPMAVHFFVAEFVRRSCRQSAKLLNVPSSSGRLWALQSLQCLFRPTRMRFFRLVTLSTLVLLAAISGRIVQRAMAADEVQKVDITPARPNRPVSLRDRLVVGLQARLKSEIAFVDAVVTEVQAGHIPQQQVDETFFWARQRAALVRDGRSHRPIIYFEPAMRIRANLLHVSL
jgi:hypothetical protein